MRLLIVVLALVLSGCATGRDSFHPVTTEGDKCKAKCSAEKQTCLDGIAKDSPKIDSTLNAEKCGTAYSDCIAPCKKYDERIRTIL